MLLGKWQEMGWRKEGKNKLAGCGSPDLCGKIKVKLLKFKKMSVFFFPGLFYFFSLEMEAGLENQVYIYAIF